MSFLFKPTALKRTLFFIFFDVAISIFTLYSAYLLRFNFYIPQSFLKNFLIVACLLILIKIIIFKLFKIYRIIWRFFGFIEAKRLVLAHLVAYSIFFLTYVVFFSQSAIFPRSVIFIDFFLSVAFIGFFRVLKRVFQEKPRKESLKKTVIIGANNHSKSIITAFLNGEIEYYPLALIEYDKNLFNTYLSNVKIFPYSKLQNIIVEEKIESAIITKEYESDKISSIFEILKRNGIEDIKIATHFEKDNKELKNISIEDLLARKPKDLDIKSISAFINDKVVLITGGGGSIGSEIARQCASFSAKKLILVDNSEYNLYSIGEELGEFDKVLRLISVTDKASILEVFDKERPEIVIHAAAFKHVPLCEENIDSAIENNIIGSKIVIDASIEFGVKKVVIISTDKAVRPTNIMGATKRIVELYAQNVDSKDTEIVAVRFGNVLGSSGSVVPKFKSQIEKGGPITVTDPEIRRYFMLIPEACQLVLQAASIANGGELFILDMGEPVKIVDLAKRMIQLYGKDGQINIVFSGLRPGEKLYEELLIDDSEQKTKYESIHVARSTLVNIDKLNSDINELLKMDTLFDKIKKINEIVPEFNHNKK